jgi:hypothetical protein
MTAVASGRMESRGDGRDDGRGDVPGLHALIEAGVLVPATRRLTEVLATRAPLQVEGAQATISALDEQRADRA